MEIRARVINVNGLTMRYKKGSRLSFSRRKYHRKYSNAIDSENYGFRLVVSRAVDPGCADHERPFRYILEIIILVLRTVRKCAHARLLIKTLRIFVICFAWERRS